MEIEKKYLITNKPNITQYNEKIVIKQGYFSFNNIEIRIREYNDKFFLTIKNQGNLIREEWEKEIPYWVFNEMWKNTNIRIEKTRYKIFENKRILEIDIFENELKGLFLLECEFLDLNEAMNFIPPKWLGKIIDVTNIPAYKNINLAKLGTPPK